MIVLRCLCYLMKLVVIPVSNKNQSLFTLPPKYLERKRDTEFNHVYFTAHLKIQKTKA